MPTTNHYLKLERQLKGWSQVYLARQIEVPDYYISRWERGEVTPSPYYQQKLCDLFGKTAQELGFLPSRESNLLASSLLPNKKTLSKQVPITANGDESSANHTEPLAQSTPIPSTQSVEKSIFSLIVVVLVGEIVFSLYLALRWYHISKYK